jgi:hypothetical protein
MPGFDSPNTAGVVLAAQEKLQAVSMCFRDSAAQAGRLGRNRIEEREEIHSWRVGLLNPCQ